jgi:branched-chain amino acid transport system permease protein
MLAQQLVSAAVLGSVYTLFALGLSLSWGVLNILNLAHGATFMLGALVVYWITRGNGLTIAAVLPVAIVVCGVISVLFQIAVYAPIGRRARDAHGAELGTLIASVGLAAIPVAIAVDVTGNQSVAIPPSVFPVHSFTVAGVLLDDIEVAIVCVALVLSLCLAWFVRKTKYGRAMRALAYDAPTCGLLGISARRLELGTMFISGALAGLAGVLLSVQLNVVEAHMGDPLLMKAFAVIILGGVGSIGGAVLAAYLLAFVETMMIVYVDASLKDLVAFALIMALLVLRPQGLFSKLGWQRT